MFIIYVYYNAYLHSCLLFVYNFVDQKQAIQRSEWQAQSQNNQLNESIHRLKNERESLQQTQEQKIKAVKSDQESLRETCEDLSNARKLDLVHLIYIETLYKDFPQVSEFVNGTSNVDDDGNQ
jgi:C4-dicarboxylate-specific signal transduction histidine kinase